MINLNPYLHFRGNAAEAMHFYETIFNSKCTAFVKYGDTPGSEKMQPADREKLIHASLPVGDGSTIIMATDILESIKPGFTIGTNVFICINTESEQEADRLFEALSGKGEVEMPVNKTMWGSYFGMCRDQFGVQWMISYAYPKK